MAKPNLAESAAKFFGGAPAEQGTLKGSGEHVFKIKTEAGRCHIVSARVVDGTKYEKRQKFNFKANRATSSHLVTFYSSWDLQPRAPINPSFLGVCSPKDVPAEVEIKFNSQRSDLTVEWVSTVLDRDQFTVRLAASLGVDTHDECDGSAPSICGNMLFPVAFSISGTSPC